MVYDCRFPEDKYVPHDFSKCKTCPQHSDKCDYILENKPYEERQSLLVL